MSTKLRHTGYIDLPSHVGGGGFDHAAVHARTGHIFVAHTANDAVDVIDPAAGRHVFSIPGLPGVAGVLVSDERQLVVTSNRAENTIGIFAPCAQPDVVKVRVGLRPNGLACDAARGLILVANVGDPAVSGSPTLTMVGIDDRKVLAEIPVPGRTRWAVHDPDAEAFYVNIAEPSQIVVVAARDPRRIARTFAVPAAGAHGLDLDLATHRLFCACDAKMLVTLDARSGNVLAQSDLSGVPDVVFFNAAHQHLYVAVGDPGVIDVLETATMKRLDSIPTEKGAHTLAFSPAGDRVYAFLPQTHRAAAYQEAEA
jgi:DNA-binding beta-propeller fold protein YncE